VEQLAIGSGWIREAQAREYNIDLSVAFLVFALRQLMLTNTSTGGRRDSAPISKVLPAMQAANG